VAVVAVVAGLVVLMAVVVIPFRQNAWFQFRSIRSASSTVRPSQIPAVAIA